MTKTGMQPGDTGEQETRMAELAELQTGMRLGLRRLAKAVVVIASRRDRRPLSVRQPSIANSTMLGVPCAKWELRLWVFPAINQLRHF